MYNKYIRFCISYANLINQLLYYKQNYYYQMTKDMRKGIYWKKNFVWIEAFFKVWFIDI